MQKVCIECGAKAAASYRWYSQSVVKLEQCGNCGENVDKYVEFDGVLVSLDVLLHRKSAFRHVIFNSEFAAHWKIGIVFLICTSFTRWSFSRPSTAGSLPAAHKLDSLLLYAMELKFYLMFLLSAFDLFVFIVATFLLIKLLSSKFESFHLHCRGIVLFSYARLVTVPLLIWGETDSNQISVSLANFLLHTSYTTAVSVLANLSTTWSAFIVGLGASLQYFLGLLAETLLFNTLGPMTL